MSDSNIKYKLDLDIAKKVIELTAIDIPRKEIARQIGVSKDYVYLCQKRLDLIL